LQLEPRLNYIGEVYKPSDDTWLLIELLNSSEAAGDLCIDLGSGSGVLGIYALLNKKCRRVVFIDIQEDAVATTSFNAVLNKVDAYSIVLQSDACETLPIRSLTTDTALVNPPYLPVEKEAPQDTSINGGVMGYEKALCFINAVSPLLKPRGRLYLVYSTLSKPEVIRAHMERLGFRVTREKIKSFFFESIIAVEAITSREN